MKELVPGYELADALKAEWVPLPDDCRSAELVAGVDAAMFIRFECFVTPDRLRRIGLALMRMAENSK